MSSDEETNVDSATMKYSLQENADNSYTLLRYGEPATEMMPSNAEVQFWISNEDLQQENRDLRRANEELREVIAMTCDIVNNWCRETGVNECRIPYKGLYLRETIDSLWSKISTRYQRRSSE